MAEQPEEIDYFASDQEPAEGAHARAHSDASADSAAEALREPLVQPRVAVAKASTGVPTPFWIGAGVIGIAFAVWMFWPSPGPTSVHRYAPQPILAQAPTGSAQAKARNPAPSVSPSPPASVAMQETTAPHDESATTPLALATSSPISPVVLSTPDVPAAAASAMSRAQAAALSDRVGALQLQVDSLSQKLDAVESHLNTEPRATKPLRAARPSSHARQTAAFASRAKSPPPAAHDDRVFASDGQPYVLDTASRDVAWIKAGEHIEIVQPGSRIGQVRVLAIDPVNRRVITSDGVIR